MDLQLFYRWQLRLTLKRQVDEIDELIVEYEIQLHNLEIESQIAYEVSEAALALFQKRFEEFKASCD